MDEHCPFTQAHQDVVIASTYIFGTGSGGSSGDPAESRCEWSDLCRFDGNGLRLSRFSRRHHFRSFHQLPHRSRGSGDGGHGLVGIDPGVEVSVLVAVSTLCC